MAPVPGGECCCCCAACCCVLLAALALALALERCSEFWRLRLRLRHAGGTGPASALMSRGMELPISVEFKAQASLTCRRPIASRRLMSPSRTPLPAPWHSPTRGRRAGLGLCTADGQMDLLCI